METIRAVLSYASTALRQAVDAWKYSSSYQKIDSKIITKNSQQFYFVKISLSCCINETIYLILEIIITPEISHCDRCEKNKDKNAIKSKNPISSINIFTIL